MPPWEGELSEEQIRDVVAYLQIATDSKRRGEVVFKTNCILCHGLMADGKGRAARMYDPPPANLTKSDKNDDYKRMIISRGGAAMGRSEFMPVWGDQLSAQEIEDVVAYLRTILVHN
ncbi:MAG TPA: c-type cytochrome [Gammaproteobacteria bacterium]|nr:c-type cytochrome [Gammaproteobacteria bacterium]